MEGSISKAAEIGLRIKQARLEAGGMKQRELADLLGVSERSVIAYETGEVVPYRFMRDLERILNKPSAWLLHGEDGAGQRDRTDEILAEMQALKKEFRALVRELKKQS